MSLPVAILVMLATAMAFRLTLRTLWREWRSGKPHLFFSPHPAFHDRAANRLHPYFISSFAMRLMSTIVLGAMTLIAFYFLLAALGLVPSASR